MELIGVLYRYLILKFSIIISMTMNQYLKWTIFVTWGCPCKNLYARISLRYFLFFFFFFLLPNSSKNLLSREVLGCEDKNLAFLLSSLPFQKTHVFISEFSQITDAIQLHKSVEEESLFLSTVEYPVFFSLYFWKVALPLNHKNNSHF